MAAKGIWTAPRGTVRIRTTRLARRRSSVPPRPGTVEYWE
jgi:hypothetical protein